MSASKTRPGVMMYFDIRSGLKRLSKAEKGELFEAVLDYGEFGVIPTFDGLLGMAWDFIQPKIDRDAERYKKISEKRTEAANTRWEKGRSITDNANNANASFAKQTIPTTTSIPSSTTTTTSTLSSTATIKATATGEFERERFLGASPYRKTDEQQFNDMRTQKINRLTEYINRPKL